MRVRAYAHSAYAYAHSAYAYVQVVREAAELLGLISEGKALPEIALMCMQVLLTSSCRVR